MDVCREIGVEPVASGSVAFLAYTKNQDFSVNDIDLSCSEAEFARLSDALNDHGIECKVTPWHVLQSLRGDLKVEFDSSEFWMNDLPHDDESLQIQDLQIRVVGLGALTELYRRGLHATADSVDEIAQSKHDALKAKYDALLALGGVIGT
ncbi:MAG TPA: hypothetical protein VNF08_05150 [Acidimicrobiales bacterium]|nr:hypothetical protein [Acidimicrobiales bacterium]